MAVAEDMDCTHNFHRFELTAEAVAGGYSPSRAAGSLGRWSCLCQIETSLCHWIELFPHCTVCKRKRNPIAALFMRGIMVNSYHWHCPRPTSSSKAHGKYPRECCVNVKAEPQSVDCEKQKPEWSAAK